MTDEQMKQIIEQVTAAVTTRPVAPTPPGPAALAPQIQPLSMMMQPPGGLAAVQPNGLLIGLELPAPDGSGTLSAYLSLPVEAVQNLPAVVGNLLAQGWPLRIFRPKAQWGNGGWGQRSNYGGWRR